MINIKKIFTGGINSDDDLRTLEPDQLLNIENCRIGISEYSKNYAVTNLQSTDLLYDINLPYNNLCIGRAKDDSRKRILWFVQNDYGLDGIYAYDVPRGNTYIVLLSSQTVEGFNFSRDYRIARNAKVVADLLEWTDNNNEPQCIDIEAGIKLNQPSYDTNSDAYATPIPYETLTLIKRPPIFQLQVEKITDNDFDNNFTALEAYQFCYMYQYKNFQYSVLSTYSALIPFNNAADTYNGITVAMPFIEDIPDYVQRVIFCVKRGNYGKTEIIQSFDKNNYYDRIAIESHNSNTTALGLTYYDNLTPIVLDDIVSNTAFDNVALKAFTLETAKNRNFLGDVLKGYDTPTDTSLQVTIGNYDTGGAGTYASQWKYFYLTYRNTTTGVTGTMQYYYAYSSTTIPTSFYYDAWKFSAAPPPSLNSADATTSWATESQLAAWAQRNIAPPVGTVWISSAYIFYTNGVVLNIVFTVDLSGLQFFKSSSLQKVSLAFYDRFRRKCGLVNPYQGIEIPDRTYNQSVFATNVTWSLNNFNAINQIPSWAYYYQLYVSKNQTTRFFAQIYVNNTAYVLKNQDDTYTYTPTTFTLNTTYAIGFNITTLTAYGLGYVFAEGDLLRAYKTDGTNVTLNVIGQDGNFIHCSPENLGTLGTGVGFMIEIYTPYKPAESEPLYENGDMLQVLNPGTDSRQYATTSGSINGDCYAIQRDKGGSDLYFVEAMSPNDKVWQIWQMDRGWVNFIDTIGQQRKETAIDFSDTYINGSKANGLNKFQASNTTDIGDDIGSVQKLQLTNKRQEDGTVMLCICEVATLSIYLGETQVISSVKNTFLAVSDGVVGTKNELKNGFGTINPESVTEYSGTVLWDDMINGVKCQYGTNGIIPVNFYGMRRFYDRYAKKYLSLTKAEIEALCGFSYIESCFDPSTGEVLTTLPQVEVSSFPSNLPSYNNITPDYASSIQNRFDIYDGQAKTLVYKYEENKWAGSRGPLPDCMEHFGNKLFGFKNGSLYLHNENADSFNTIYGVEYPQRICFVCNASPSALVDLFDMAIEGNKKPNFSVALAPYPDTQITDLVDTDFTTLEGIQYAKWFRDRLSPNATGTADERLYKGDVLKSATIMVMLEFQEYDSQLILNFVNLGFEISAGHSQILK